MKFIAPSQQGLPVQWPGGIVTTIVRRGHDIRIELYASGVVAAEINREMMALTAPTPEAMQR